jgi:hypothetical protein
VVAGRDNVLGMNAPGVPIVGVSWGPGYNLGCPCALLGPLLRYGDAAVVERQTRQLEGLVPARVWGFKSPSPHDRRPRNNEGLGTYRGGF